MERKIKMKNKTCEMCGKLATSFKPDRDFGEVCIDCHTEQMRERIGDIVESYEVSNEEPYTPVDGELEAVFLVSHNSVNENKVADVLHEDGDGVLFKHDSVNE